MNIQTTTRRAVGLMLLGLALGCGGANPATEQANSNAGSNAGAAPSPATPELAVNQFLAAVKRGDDEQASAMLTPLARERTAERELVVAPPGSETAEYQVGEVEMVAADAAHVASKWTDVGEDGQPHTDMIVWILRLESEGWRIAGMGTTIFEGEPPLFLNFENPDDMIRKQQLAEEEMRRRAQAEEDRQAQAPGEGRSAAAGSPSREAVQR